MINCQSLPNVVNLLHCPHILSIFRALTVVDTEAAFIYDKEEGKIVVSSILSATIQAVLQSRDIQVLLEEHSAFALLELQQQQVWSLVEDPYNAFITMNLCLDRSTHFYVTLRATPIQIASFELRFLMCTLEFSSQRCLEVNFIDRISSSIWRYLPSLKKFIKEDIPQLSKKELEMIRLARMGYKEKEIAQLMFCGRDTIKQYKRRVFEKTNTTNIPQAVSFCKIHHLI